MTDPILIGLTGRKRSGKNTVADFITDELSARDMPSHAFGFADAVRAVLRTLDPYVDGPVPGKTDDPNETARLIRRTFAAFESVVHVTPTISQAQRTVKALDAPTTGTVRLSDLLEHQTFDQLKDENDPVHRQVRRLLQNLGTEGARDVYSQTLWTDHALDQAATLMAPGTSPVDERPISVVLTDCRFDNEAEGIRDLGGRIIQIVRPSLPAPTDKHASERGIRSDLIDAVIMNDGSLEDLHASAQAALAALRLPAFDHLA